MAEINIEKKNAVWPWILAAIIVLLLIWLLVEAFDRDDDAVTAADRTVATEPAVATPGLEAERAADPAAPAGTAADMQRFAGTYSSDNMQLVLQADGSYSMQESPAGEGQGTWTHDAGANALHLTPADGSQARYFRIEGDNALMPLGPDGQPAGQMAQLTRQSQD